MTSPRSFTILYFASAKDYTRKEKELLEAPLDIGKLFTVLENKYPGIQAKVLSSCLVTVNLEYVELNDQIHIKDGDEVAIIPPNIQLSMSSWILSAAISGIRPFLAVFKDSSQNKTVVGGALPALQYHTILLGQVYPMVMNTAFKDNHPETVL